MSGRLTRYVGLRINNLIGFGLNSVAIRGGIEFRSPPVRCRVLDRTDTLKHYRKIATRYDKKAANFLGYILLGSIMLHLR